MQTARPAGRDAIDVHTLAEAASILRVKPSWLERQAAARKIPFTMLGGSYRFTSQHLALIVALYESLPVRCEHAAVREPRMRTEEVPRQNPNVRPLVPRPRNGARRPRNSQTA